MNGRSESAKKRLKELKDRAEAESFDRFVEKIMEEFRADPFYERSGHPCVFCDLSYTSSTCPNRNKDKEMCYLSRARVYAERVWELDGRFV